MAAAIPPQVALQLRHASGLIQQGQLDAAESSLSAIVQQFPACADAHYLRGVTASLRNDDERALEALQRALALDKQNAGYHLQTGIVLVALGRPAEAVPRYRDAARLNPNQAEAHYNLGVALQTTGDRDGAIAAYRAALLRRTDFVEALNNLGNLLLARGQVAEAMQLLQRAIAARPHFHIPYNSVGNALVKLKRNAEAIAVFKKALEIEPAFAEARSNLAEQLHIVGKDAESAEQYERLLTLQPDNANARFALAALRSETPPAPPESFVRKVFEDLAQSFDEHLVDTLEYGVPKLLIAELRPWLNSRERVSVLDLGCGTGLFGIEVKPWSSRLDGIDLSPSMVNRSRERGVYDGVQVAELAAHLATLSDGSLDLITATDVFIYCGDIAKIFTEVRRVIRADGRFAFSVEASSAADYVLRSSCRYAHSKQYVERLANDNEFRIVTALDTPIRKERGEPIPGYLFILEAGGS